MNHHDSEIAIAFGSSQNCAWGQTQKWSGGGQPETPVEKKHEKWRQRHTLMIHFILALQTCSCHLGRNMWRRELYLDQAVVTGQHHKPNLTFIDLRQHHSVSSDKLHRWAQIRKAYYQGLWHCRYARYVNRWCGHCSGSWDTAEVHFLDTGRNGSLTNRAQTVGNQNPSCGLSWA